MFLFVDLFGFKIFTLYCILNLWPTKKPTENTSTSPISLFGAQSAQRSLSAKFRLSAFWATKCGKNFKIRIRKLQQNILDLSHPRETPLRYVSMANTSSDTFGRNKTVESAALGNTVSGEELSLSKNKLHPSKGSWANHDSTTNQHCPYNRK